MWQLAFIKLYSFFAATDACKSNSFFGFPHWYQYMKLKPDGAGGCAPVFPQNKDFFHEFLSGLLPIGLAVLDMLLYAAGFVAVLMVIAAGLEFIFAGGETDKAAEARKRIQNSLIGLVIAVSATAIVSFIGKAVAP